MKYEAIVRKARRTRSQQEEVDAKSANESRHPMTFQRKHKRDIRGVEKNTRE